MFNLAVPAEAHAGHDHGFFGELIEQLVGFIPVNESWQEFISHFIVDTLNILFILAVVMTAVYFISSYIDTSKLHHKLAHLKSIWGFALAIALGALSPFCSCSIIPILIGFISVGVPLSVCLCYLTASSMLNITAIISLFAVSGVKFGTAYVVASLLIIIISSVIFALLKLDTSVKEFHHGHDEHHHHDEPFKRNEKMFKRFKSALLSMLCVMKKCVLFVVIGVAISSAIMVFVSMDTLVSVINGNGILSALVAGVIGLPIHSDVFSISPILLLLIDLSPGVALTLALSTMAISVPSVVILTRAIKGKTVCLYCITISLLAILIGCLSLLVL